ncbi:tyrosine-type recombinase/integrase [Streptomyces sp. NEAU-Y11]|uniref:tyrosine-type recombinase/integrase n=1 Tax=Streptomyces cucumeris TaxID=2962890 RepID=UPI0020C86FFE|nr:site-specific integrase [Streptomyces sp. NEAU-Y11]MCP9205560.1 site-specific integrase [Streptomyces sp. NEAU-Y11]
MASAAHGKGKRWQARYDGPDGKERTSLWRTLVEAEKEILKQEGAKLTGSWIDPERGKLTVEHVVFDVWLPSTSTIERTRREYRGVMNRYLVPEWGHREIRSIRPSEAGAWQGLLTSQYELTGSTPNRVARLVRSVFHLAVLDRMIPVSPFAGVKAPTLEETQVDPPDIAEVMRLIGAAYHDRWAVMVEFTALTGLRSGELRGLRLDAIDFLRRELRVSDQLVYEAGEGLRFDKLKTSSGRRTLPLTKRAVDLLAAYVAAHPPATSGEWEGLVFTMGDHKPIGESTLDWAIKNICRKAKAKARHWHELRHHYASVLIAGGENPKVVQKRLGHKDVLTTLRVYSHLWAEAEEQTRTVLDGAWEKARSGLLVPEGGAAREESPAASGTLPESGSSSGALALVKP